MIIFPFEKPKFSGSTGSFHKSPSCHCRKWSSFWWSLLTRAWKLSSLCLLQMQSFLPLGSGCFETISPSVNDDVTFLLPFSVFILMEVLTPDNPSSWAHCQLQWFLGYMYLISRMLMLLCPICNALITLTQHTHIWLL